MFFLTHEGRYTDNIRRQIRSTLVYNLRDARIIMKARIPESIEKQPFIRIDALDGVYREGERVKSTACISPDGRRRTTAVIWTQWKQATAHKSGNLKSCDAEWDTAGRETLLQRRIRRSTKSTQTLHGNTRDGLIKQELNSNSSFWHYLLTLHTRAVIYSWAVCYTAHVRNRRYTSQDIFKALLLGFDSTVCFLCLDVRKVLESGECEWWQNLQLFMNALDFQRDAWVCEFVVARLRSSPRGIAYLWHEHTRSLSRCQLKHSQTRRPIISDESGNGLSVKTNSCADVQMYSVLRVKTLFKPHLDLHRQYNHAHAMHFNVTHQKIWIKTLQLILLHINHHKSLKGTYNNEM